MRTALFFDGKNHMSDLRRQGPDLWIDHGELARWVVDAVGGTQLIAAHYYTGVPTALDEPRGRRALSRLLRELEAIPGFLVHRFERQTAVQSCDACGADTAYTREKQVDTALVADMVLLAARDAFDVAVVFSGDLDMAPGLRALQQLGKPGWVATFDPASTSRHLRRAAFGVLDLGTHLEHFAAPSVEEALATDRAPRREDMLVLAEIERAEAHFAQQGGFLGAHYFLNRWRGRGLPDDASLRQASTARLIAAGLVETYDVDGRTALRLMGGFPGEE